MIRSKTPLHCNAPFLAALLFLLAGFSPSLAVEVRCDLCGSKITGQYMSYAAADGKKLEVCQKCLDTKPKCALCGIPVNHSAASGSPLLCNDCRRVAVSCQLCNQLITSKYVTYHPPGRPELHVCDHCERTMPRCSSCQVPHRAENLRRTGKGEIWCLDCLARAPRCSLCQNPMMGTYYEIPFVDGRWCADCFEHRIHCSTCGAPMSDAAASLFDGRHICARCYETSVTGSQKLEEIRDAVLPEMRKLLGRPVHPPPIRAVTAGELRSAMAEGDIYVPDTHEGLMPTVREMGLFRVLNGEREILILDTMPEDMAWETVAHELAHAWHHQYYPHSRDPVIVEGFAQWVAEQICYKTYRRTTLDRLRNRQDFYGMAFRTIQQVELRGGSRAVIRALEANELPSRVGGN